MSGDAFDGAGVKQIRAVYEAAQQAFCPIVELQIKVEFRCADVEIKLAQVPSRLDRRPRRHQRKHYGEYRASTGVASDGKFLYQPVKWGVIVGERSECHFPRMP